MRKPESLVYGVDDLPPPRVAFFAALQQVAFLGALLGVPSVAAVRLHLSHQQFSDVATATLFCAGLGLVLQGLGRFGIGSRLFYPLQCTTAALPALLYAGSAGLDLTQSFTMVVVVGFTQLFFSFVIVRLRGIFTVEVAGLSVFLIGVGLGHQGLLLIFSAPPSPNLAVLHAAVAGLTFATLIVLHVYVQNRLRLFTTLIGLSVGLIAATVIGLVDPAEMDMFRRAPWFSLPNFPVFGWDFQAGAIAPFIFTGFAFALTSVGVQIIAQRTNDRDWKSPDFVSISRGIRAEGVVHILASVLNALPMVASGGAVALAAASGCTARTLAYWTGGLLMLFSILPKAVAIWFLIPDAVTGALFLFLATFTTVNGVQLVASRVLDARKVLAVGVGFVTAMAYEPLRALIEGHVPELRLITFSSFALSITVTVVLLALFRIGVKRKLVRRFPTGSASHNEVADFLEAEGGRWGARVDVVQRAAQVAWQAIDLIGHELVDPDKPTIEVATSYDEVIFDVILRYQGTAPTLSNRPPTEDELLENPDHAQTLTGFLITRLVEDVRMQRNGQVWELHFRLHV